VYEAYYKEVKEVKKAQGFQCFSRIASFSIPKGNLSTIF
jgi:hypothetical protein